MITKLKIIFAIAGLSAFVAAPLLAGNYSHFISSNQQFEETVSVPAAASCTQVGAVYWSFDNTFPIATINGPLGLYYVSIGNPLSLNNVPISAGSYNIYGNVYGSGYCGVQISW